MLSGWARHALTRPRLLLPKGLLDAIAQLTVLVLAYKLYQGTRGLINDQLGASQAFSNADLIVSVERTLGLDMEIGIQSMARRVPGLLDASSLVYINAQFSVTFGAVVYIYVRHNHAFGFVRNMFIGAWALALAAYVLFPTAPPRLVPGLGIQDAVAEMTNVDPADQNSSVSKLFNPYAAVPSMHVGFALMIGVPLARLSAHRTTRVLWAVYPALVLFVVMATGNHFFLDGAFGAATVVVAALAARRLGRIRPHVWQFGPVPATDVGPADRRQRRRPAGVIGRSPDPDSGAPARVVLRGRSERGAKPARSEPTVPRIRD